MSLGAVIVLILSLTHAPRPTPHTVALAEAISSVCEGEPECVRLLIALGWFSTRFQETSPWGATLEPASLNGQAHAAYVRAVHARRRCGQWQEDTVLCAVGRDQRVIRLMRQLERRRHGN